MIITTTPTVEGRQIADYQGIVFGEVITGINVLKDIGAGLRNFFGGRCWKCSSAPSSWARTLW